MNGVGSLIRSLHEDIDRHLAVIGVITDVSSLCGDARDRACALRAADGLEVFIEDGVRGGRVRISLWWNVDFVWIFHWGAVLHGQARIGFRFLLAVMAGV